MWRFTHVKGIATNLKVFLCSIFESIWKLLEWLNYCAVFSYSDGWLTHWTSIIRPSCFIFQGFVRHLVIMNSKMFGGGCPTVKNVFICPVWLKRWEHALEALAAIIALLVCQIICLMIIWACWDFGVGLRRKRLCEVPVVIRKLHCWSQFYLPVLPDLTLTVMLRWEMRYADLLILCLTASRWQSQLYAEAISNPVALKLSVVSHEQA